jgi:diketogulonate reductase-like aldo/keto reductase
MTDWNPPANVLTSAELKRQAAQAARPEQTALQWLLQQRPAPAPRSKAVIDHELAAERDW